MVSSGKGIYISKIGDHSIKVVNRGNNTCSIYLNEIYQGSAPADYVERQITLNKSKKQALNAYCKNSEYDGAIPEIDVSV